MPFDAPIDRLLSTRTPYLADGGLETDLIYHDGIDLPGFASFPLVFSDEGQASLRRYFARYVDHAAQAGTGFMLDTATWRASTAWGERLGFGRDAIVRANREAARLAREIRAEYRSKGLPIVINGAVGPAGDGYVVGRELAPVESEAIHRTQIEALAEAGVDLVTATTMTHLGEAVGIVRAARAAGLPVAVSFTVETDGRLASGMALAEAVTATDEATQGAPVYYMVNCAHPDHFAAPLGRGEAWLDRLGGIRANASRMSHAELDAATTLDDGDPAEFGALYAEFLRRLPGLKVLGGCCGTDHRHIHEVGRNIRRAAA